MRGNPQALFGKRPTEKDPAKGTSSAVDFTREGARGKRPVATPAPRPRAYLTPGLFAQLAALPWRQVPVAHDTRERGHGRDERRVIKVTAVAAGLAFPHAAQAIQIVRRRKLPGEAEMVP